MSKYAQAYNTMYSRTVHNMYIYVQQCVTMYNMCNNCAAMYNHVQQCATHVPHVQRATMYYYVQHVQPSCVRMCSKIMYVLLHYDPCTYRIDTHAGMQHSM